MTVWLRASLASLLVAALAGAFFGMWVMQAAVPRRCDCGQPTKVFVLGAHKTGTTSMLEALEMLGFNALPVWLNAVAPRSRRNLGTPEHDSWAGFWHNQTRLYEAFKDSPFNHGDYFRTLHAAYPCASWILTVERDSLVWLDRLYRFVQRPWVAQNDGVQAWGRVYGVPGEAMERGGRWVRAIPWAAAALTLEHATAVRRHYETRNAQVRAYFAGRARGGWCIAGVIGTHAGNERFAEIAVNELAAQGWPLLARLFPWKSAPLVPFPHSQQSHAQYAVPVFTSRPA